ncbi:MAG: restriction endonuclease subunit S [Alphaproteobacteria bacterium]|nr:restriction endonuclease subunit S [Alphaproteobacteria bacterium]
MASNKTKNWQKVKLGDVCHQITDGVHNTVKDCVCGEYYLLSCKNIKNGQIVIGKDERRIDETTLQNLRKRTKTSRGDVLLSSVGTIGETAVIKDDFPNYEFQRSVAIFKPNKDYIISEFLFYSLNNNKKLLQHSAEGAVQQCLFINPLKEFVILLPPLTIQKKIAGVLSALDDKIELNNKINQNLEQQAQALFKSWFIDFEPFGGTMPTDWKIGIVDEIIELYDSKRIPLSSNQREKMAKLYPYYGATSLMDYVDEYIFDGKYLLLGEDGTVIDDQGFPILQYVWGKFWVNNHAHIMRGKNGFDVESLYLFFKQKNVKNIVTGAVQPKINQANLKALSVTIPSGNIMNRFNKTIQPLFDLIRNKHEENTRLVQLRDTLLPKLMNGEIDVSQVDISKEIADNAINL